MRLQSSLSHMAAKLRREVCVFVQVSLGGVSHPAVPKVTEHLLSQPEPVIPNTALLVKNPLASTHVFKQACHICYPKTGDVFPLPPTALAMIKL